MSLLNFEAPKKIKIEAGFEDGPEGGYVPQMSTEDSQRWKAKKFNIGKPNARIELRKTFGPTQVFIIVARDGWDLSSKHEYRDNPKSDFSKYYGRCTKGLQVRMSMNGPLLMSLGDFNEINAIVAEAMDYLTVDKDEKDMIQIDMTIRKEGLVSCELTQL